MSDILRLLAFAETHRHEPLALATIVRTRGSTYRRASTRMLIAASGAMQGQVSGGCLEHDIAEHARAVLASGQPRLLTYDTRLTFGCHGLLEILVEPLSGPGGHLLDHCRKRLAQRRPALIATAFAGSASPLGSQVLGTDTFPAAWQEPAQAALLAGTSTLGTAASDTTSVFFGVIPPPPRLAIIGAGPDTVPLAQQARYLAWETLCVSHPGEPTHIAAPSPLGISRIDPPALAARLRDDPLTAVVLMTHHFGRDLAYLTALLPLGLPYLGLLGPRQRREQLLTTCADQGLELTPESLINLYSPAGLDIGSETPEEIALAIVSEIRAVLSGRQGGFLRDRRAAIHPVTSPRSSSPLNPSAAA